MWDMMLLPPSLSRRSVTLAAGALVVSCGLGLAFVPLLRGVERPSEMVYGLGGVASLLALVLCCLAWVNLMRDAEQGYGVVRCSVAAVLLLAATAGPLFGMLFAIRQLTF